MVCFPSGTRQRVSAWGWWLLVCQSLSFTLHFQYFAVVQFLSFLSFCFKVCPLFPVPGEAAHSRFYSALRRLVTSQHIANRYAIFPCSLDVEIKSSWDTLYVTSLFLPIYLRQHNAQCFLAHSTSCMRWDSLCVGRTRITLSLPRLAWAPSPQFLGLIFFPLAPLDP